MQWRQIHKPTQISKSYYLRCISKMRTPIERFYPELWDTDTARQRLKEFPFYNETYEDAIKVSNTVVHLVFICCIIVRYYMLFPTTSKSSRPKSVSQMRVK